MTNDAWIVEQRPFDFVTCLANPVASAQSIGPTEDLPELRI